MSKYVLALMMLLLVGCVEVGGSSTAVCTGTECGTHDESNNSVTTTTDTTD
jgi:hypothetical protein